MDLVGRRIASVIGDWTAEQPQRFTTHEGEHAALVSGAGTRGEAISWCIATVVADDFYSYLEGFSPSSQGATLRNVCRDLAITETFDLGQRRRRFVFAPPHSWSGLVIGDRISHYFPADYPLVDARISVFPAVPFNASSPPFIDLQRLVGEHILVQAPGASGGFKLERRIEREFVSSHGLAGLHLTFEGRWRSQEAIREIVVTRDERYVYATELATRADVHARVIDVFLPLAHSVEPIPAPSSATAHSGNSPFIHFAE